MATRFIILTYDPADPNATAHTVATLECPCDTCESERLLASLDDAPDDSPEDPPTIPPPAPTLPYLPH
jgi:hypothetical protein